MFPRAAIPVTCSQSSLLVPSQVPEWTSQHLLWHGGLRGKRSRSDDTGCLCGRPGSRRGRCLLAKPLGALPWPRGLGATWVKMGCKAERERGGMERVGDRFLSPPPTSSRGWELVAARRREQPSRLVAPSVSYKNALVTYGSWWQALAGVAVPAFGAGQTQPRCPCWLGGRRGPPLPAASIPRARKSGLLLSIGRKFWKMQLEKEKEKKKEFGCQSHQASSVVCVYSL